MLLNYIMLYRCLNQEDYKLKPYNNMTLLIIIVVFLILAFFLKSKMDTKKPTKIELPKKHPFYGKGYQIKGITYRNLPAKFHGTFNGYIKAEPENPYDSYAIAVYVIKNNKETLVGYLPKGNEDLSKYLQNNGEMKVSGALGVNGHDPLEDTYQDVLDMEDDLSIDDLSWEGAVILKELIS